MKKAFILFVFASAFTACSQTASEDNSEFGRYGDTTFSAEGALMASELPTALEGKDSLRTVIKGEVTAACQAKGCWMSMDVGQEEAMTVTFVNYGFFVPKNSAGHEAIISGVAFRDTTSVAMLQEYAKDAEKSEEEISAITQPKFELKFIADGVIMN